MTKMSTEILGFAGKVLLPWLLTWIVETCSIGSISEPKISLMASNRMASIVSGGGNGGVLEDASGADDSPASAWGEVSHLLG